MWIYQIDKGHCIKVSTQRSKDSGKTPADSELQPLPAGPTLRYAHQVVYDHQSKIFYLFGGTDVGDTDQRLNDLWVCSVQSEEPRSSSPINLDSPEVNNSALPASSAISSRVGSTQGSDSSFPSPIPDFNQPIARAIGDSFPPPPSPAGDMDPELPYGRPRPSRRWNSHEMDIHRGFRRITSPYRSSPPPPAPIMQYRSLPSAVSRSVSHITDLASTNGETDADPGDKAEPPNIPDSPFRDRRRLFDELMCFIVPEAKEPPKDVTELLGGPPPLELDYAMLK
ncbi:hypothetical protein FRC02_009105 [Tulasnella sp. 418]|nr:hypothetical protein FRC02_009105 [Tulasnella sp. 418]